MFTGIVETIGRIARSTPQPAGRSLEIEARFPDALEAGDSVAVNGCCLTVVASQSSGFAVDVVAETIERSTIGTVAAGDRVNLERAMRLDGRLDGHLVQGHVDGVGTVRELRNVAAARWIAFEMPAGLAPYVAEKGSIAVDGTSLTVTRVDRDGFEVALIPHTLERTIAGDYRPGRRVNLEVDVVARYVARLWTTLREGG